MAAASPPAASHDLSVFPTSLRNKRILLCTESFGPVNGVSRTTLSLVNHLRQHGAQVAVVAPLNHTQSDTFTSPPPSSSTSEYPKDLRLPGYPLPFNPELSIVHPLRTSTLYTQTFGPDSPPDLIYLASPASLGFQVLLQVRQHPSHLRAPIICNFQTDLAGYCAILFPWPLGRVGVAAFSAVQGYLFRHESVATIFYPSRFARRYLERQGVRGEKLELLTRGVDTGLFKPGMRSEALRRELAPCGEVILLTVARIAGEKGFDFLAQTVKDLDARGLRFTLYIVGGNHNTTVETQIHALFPTYLPLTGSRVVFAGFKHGADLATAYASADIFVYCSVTETFGLVVLEAMASGVPVVARDEGGPSDIVEHGRRGSLSRRGTGRGLRTRL